MRKITIEDMRKLAGSKRGKCLSTEYVNALTKLKWMCKEGHIWEAKPNEIKSGRWCSYCAGKAKLTIEEMQELAKRKGGKCLSTEYINNNTKLKWQCGEGHTWEATPHGIKSGKWCPYCAGLVKLTIEEMQELAEEKDGKCLSAEYINNHTKLRWQCKEGHMWEARPCDIKNSIWCPTCAGITKLTIEEMQRLAKRKGGKCLSTEYINTDTKLKWQCKEGHTWEAKPHSIKSGEWCPICSTGISERICRKYFEIIFNEKFPKVNLPRSSYSGKRRLELDGCCKKLGIAFEYQGKQHYEDIGFFHKTRTLKQQKEYDILKKKLCKQYNIILIDIPYTVQYEDMYKYIIQKCKKNNIKISEIPDEISYKSFVDVYSPEMLKEMQELAKNNGGKCLSTEYINTRTKLKWQCKEGHTWKATPHSIKRGRWCPYCGGTAKLTIEEMQKLAEKKGGKCLSTEYINSKTKLKWQCKEGHIWEARPGDIKSGEWCPYCGTTKLTIEEMQELAEEKGGKCLSTEYINNRTKLKWQCKKGHTWEATANNIKKGEWCPYCGTTKLTIEELQELAEEKGGKCLSTEYINNRTKLKWQCKKGHTWEATPTHIKSGTWCPICARKKFKKQNLKI